MNADAAGNLTGAAVAEVAVTAADAPMLSEVGYDVLIDDAEVIEFGRLRLHAIHNPGHTPGSISFALEGTPLLFTGDTLFVGKIGGTATEEQARTEHDSLFRVMREVTACFRRRSITARMFTGLRSWGLTA